MISKDTAIDIAMAYREIETAEKLLEEVRGQIERTGRAHTDIRDAFGRSVQGLQLGIPTGDSGQRLFTLQWSLAEPVIVAHIAHQRARMAVLTETARAEIAKEAPSDGR